MARILRLLWLALRGLLAAIFVVGLLETVQGAPNAIDWLADAGVTKSPTLGVILAAIALVVVGLTALGPVRVKRWLALAREGRSSAVAGLSSPETPEISAFEREATRPGAWPPQPHVVHVSRASHYEAGKLGARREMTPLERWLQGRLDEHAVHARERAVRGDRAYLAAMWKWDVANIEGLYGDPKSNDRTSGVAPELTQSYREPPGFPVGATPAQQEAYYDQKVEWLKGKLRELHDASPESQAQRVQAQDIRDMAGQLASSEMERSLQESERTLHTLALAKPPASVAQGESLPAWLDRRVKEMQGLKRRLEDVLATVPFQRAKAESIEAHFLEINNEIDRKLHTSAPQWVDYFNENPTRFPMTLTFVRPEQYRNHLVGAIDSTLGQVAHIRARLGDA